jgi:hypothetical protein
VALRVKGTGVLVGAGLLFLLVLGWWLWREARRDSCLDKGGTWHAEAGTCGGMYTPGP